MNIVYMFVLDILGFPQSFKCLRAIVEVVICWNIASPYILHMISKECKHVCYVILPAVAITDLLFNYLCEILFI